MEQILLWVVIALTALVIDILTSSFFFGGFTIGGIFALIAQIMGYSMISQVIVFIIVSAAAILAEFVWLRKKIKRTIPETLKMEEEYIGRTVTVEEDISEKGRIKVGGIYWSAENTGDSVNAGEKVTIVGIKGNKLIIKK